MLNLAPHAGGVLHRLLHDVVFVLLVLTLDFQHRHGPSPARRRPRPDRHHLIDSVLNLRLLPLVYCIAWSSGLQGPVRPESPESALGSARARPNVPTSKICPESPVSEPDPKRESPEYARVSESRERARPSTPEVNWNVPERLRLVPITTFSENRQKTSKITRKRAKLPENHPRDLKIVRRAHCARSVLKIAWQLSNSPVGQVGLCRLHHNRPCSAAIPLYTPLAH